MMSWRDRAARALVDGQGVEFRGQGEELGGSEGVFDGSDGAAVLLSASLACA